MEVSVIGSGNVGVATAADLSINGHEVTLIKTSDVNKSKFEKIKENGNKILLKENGTYSFANVHNLTYDIEAVRDADVIVITTQSTYHEDLIRKISRYLNEKQLVVIICSYMSSFYFKKSCKSQPSIAETTGPYLEGRIEEHDVEGEIVFRVGCRLTRCPYSLVPSIPKGWDTDKDGSIYEKCKGMMQSLCKGFSHEYNYIESALLNPNLVLHTVGSVMSIPRIEFTKGNFCMYREAYARGNDSTLKIMLQLDEEKKAVLKALRCKPIDIFEAGGFLGDPLESFYKYSESSDRAISPTSVRSRYITEDVSQGLVLLESIAEEIGVKVPITSAIINIAGAALCTDFRKEGRTVQRLQSKSDIKLYARV